MRKKLVTLIAVSALALAGCTSAESSSEIVTGTPTPASEKASSEYAKADVAEVEEAYLAEYKQMAGNVDLYPEEELVDIGYETCELMEDDKAVPHDFTGNTQGDRSVGIPAGMAARVTLCPDVVN